MLVRKSVVLALCLFSLLTACSKNHSNKSLFNFSLSDNWIGEPNSIFREGLKTVHGKKYMISTSSDIASKVGAEILKKGGNAVDAAIAAQLVLNVVEPQSSGIGGGSLMVYYDKRSGHTIYFNGRETAPAKAHAKMFLDKNGQAREFSDVVRGGLSVGVPGTLRLMRQTHKLYGKLPWWDLFKPAIKIARNGFEVSPRLHNLSKQVSYLKDFKETAEIYLKEDGEPYEVGEIMKNEKLADTFQTLSRKGTLSFYGGKIASHIADAVQKSKINPGYLTFNDINKYYVIKGELLCTKYRWKYKVCTTPKPSSAVTMLQILGILENFDLAKLGPDSTKAAHLIIEATRLAYADRNKYVGNASPVPLYKMLRKRYLKKRAALISDDKKIERIYPGKLTRYKNLVMHDETQGELPTTTHISVVDKEGNAVSMTSSIEYFFGSALSVDGFLLNNQLTDFSFKPVKNGQKVANRVRPRRQPRSSMSPTFVFDNKDNLIMVVGSPGGPRIIQFVAKAIINHLDFGLDIQNAISKPSFVVLNDIVELEEDQDISKLKSNLKKLGHKVKFKPLVSGINAITIKGNKLSGGTDPRREGSAIGQ